MKIMKCRSCAFGRQKWMLPTRSLACRVKAYGRNQFQGTAISHALRGHAARLVQAVPQDNECLKALCFVVFGEINSARDCSAMDLLAVVEGLRGSDSWAFARRTKPHGVASAFRPPRPCRSLADRRTKIGLNRQTCVEIPVRTNVEMLSPRQKSMLGPSWSNRYMH